jgi:hypothetical protein
VAGFILAAGAMYGRAWSWPWWAGGVSRRVGGGTGTGAMGSFGCGAWHAPSFRWGVADRLAVGA